jgi:4-amino-4-deoxy-L-arabinose transferase-like glycosyltransferase
MALVVAACFGVYLLGNQRVPLWDRDEPRYAEASREMLQSGDWVTPTFLNHWRAKKPPLIYWCQAAAMAVLGPTGAAARLPSTLAIVTVAILLARFLPRAVGTRRAVWTVLIFCTSALPIGAAKMAITDSVLLVWLIVGQGCLWMMRRDERLGRPRRLGPAILMWIAIGVGGLTKGPIVIGLLLATMVVLAGLETGRQWRRRAAWKAATCWWRRTRPVIGLLIAAAIMAPWLILIHQRSPGFLTKLWLEAVFHAAGTSEKHGAPPGFHLALVFGTFFPWSLLLPLAAISAFHRRHEPRIAFAIAAVTGPWIVMECVGTKLPHYVLPAFPPLALLTADALVRCLRGRNREMLSGRFKILAVIWGAAFIGIVNGMTLLLLFKLHVAVPGASSLLASSLLLGAGVPLLVITRRLTAAAVAMGVFMMVFVAVIFGVVFARLDLINLSRKTADELYRQGFDGKSFVNMIDYKEPSLAFALQGQAREADDVLLLDNPPSMWPQWLVMTREMWDRLPAEKQAQLNVLSFVHGAMYSNQRMVDVLIVKRRD